MHNENLVDLYHHRGHCWNPFLAWSLHADSQRGSRSLQSSLVVGHNYFILNPGAVKYSAYMVSFCSTSSIFTQARRSGSFTKLWRVLYVTVTHLVLLPLHLWTNEFCSWETATTICSLNTCIVLFWSGSIGIIKNSGTVEGLILDRIVLLLGFIYFSLKNLGTSSDF